MVKRAFSLLEVVVTLALLGIMVSFALLQWHTPRSGASTQGLGEAVAETLRLARQRAIAEQMPVAVSFPGPHTVVLREGVERADVRQVFHYAGEYPGTVLFTGSWVLDPTRLRDPSSHWDATPLTLGLADDNFAPDPWAAACADPMLIFTPCGRVTAKNFSHFDADFHIVVSQGVDAAGPQLEGWHKAVTVCVSGLGSVRLEAGVAGSSLADAGHDLGGTSTQPPPARPIPGNNNNPRILAVHPYPEPNPAVLPAGASVLVAAGDSLNLEVEASDPDGDPLWVHWLCPKGAFSYQESEPMRWDPVSRHWKAVVNWTPPESAAAGSQYRLDCNVEDRRGGNTLAQNDLLAHPQVAIGTTLPLLFCRYDIGQFRSRIWATNLDGSGERCLSELEPYPDMPILSPDGQRVCYVERTDHVNGWDHYRMYRFHIMNLDGSDDTALGSPLRGDDLIYNAAWSPDSAYLALMDNSALDTEGERMVIVNVESPNLTQYVAHRPGPGKLLRFPSWSPDGRHLLFVSDQDTTTGNFQVYSLDLSGWPPPSTRLTNSNAHDTRAIYRKDGNKILFGSSDGAWHVCEMDADGGNRHVVMDLPGLGTATPKYSPDGKLVMNPDEQGVWVRPADLSLPAQKIGTNSLSFAQGFASDGRILFDGDNNVVNILSRRSLYVMRADGSNVVRLTPLDVVDGAHGRFGPQFPWW